VSYHPAFKSSRAKQVCSFERESDVSLAAGGTGGLILTWEDPVGSFDTKRPELMRCQPLARSQRIGFGLFISAVAVLLACKAELVESFQSPGPPVTAPKELLPVAGDDQRAPAGTTLPQALIARAYDSTGIPFPGIPVTWAAAQGQLSQAETVTNATGAVSAVWTLGPTPGPQTATVSSPGLGSVTFNSLATAVLLRLVLTPSLVTLQPQGSQRFTVSGEFSDGSTRSVSAHFTAAGGTITSDGVYTAGSVAGSFLVVAGDHGLADTSVVNITVPSATLQSIQLSPRSESISTGASLQFTVSGTMSDGTTIVPSVSYSASGGSISPDGLYTAGPTAGTFFVKAIQLGGVLQDSVGVVLAATTIGGAAPDIFSWSFEDGTIGSMGLDGPTAMNIVNTDHAVVGEEWAAQYAQDPNVNYDGGAGHDWPGSGTRADRDVWVRFAAKWTGYPSFIQKVFRFKTGDRQGNGGSIIIQSNRLVWVFDTYDPNSNYDIAPVFSVNQWHWIEIHYQMPASGKPTVAIYLDGRSTPAFTKTCINSSNGDAIGFYQFFGTVNPNTNTFTWTYDAPAIGTQRVGLPSGAIIGP
jgi:hypothetical protein